MADNLPLIPGKQAICNDVRAVLREVFRERDYLPPLVAEQENQISQIVDTETQREWIEKYAHDCQEIREQETELKKEYAQRLANRTPSNLYRLSSGDDKPDPPWRLKTLIARKDLVPQINDNAASGNSLWVRNILNHSSCDVSRLQVNGSKIHCPITFPADDDQTVQSLSIGNLVIPGPPERVSGPLPSPTPGHILCVPSQMSFVNFTVGQQYVQTIRIINVSKHELRLSLKPPSYIELAVVIRSPRGLTVTAGATAELGVQFTPKDVRVIKDSLKIRASVGKPIEIPINCYVEAPVLDVMLPKVTWSTLSCMPSEYVVRRGGDVLELGARLLGDVHYVRLLLNCDTEQASFFVLTEDAWISFCLDTLTKDGAVIASPFTISPAWWKGGGSVHGGAWCRAPHAGLHATALRVLASTGVARPLHLLADSLMFAPTHVTLEAEEKNYDICSESDPGCEYYAHLGTAFPNESLSSTVQLINHSPLVYPYYWSVRPWGVCSCWEDEQANKTTSKSTVSDDSHLCVGAMEAKYLSKKDSKVKLGVVESNVGLVRVEPAKGRLAPRTSCTMHICVPNVGTRLGVQRAVLMLILKDIPSESFPEDYDPMLVKTDIVASEVIPGHKPCYREACEVVCTQLEVWWEVVPMRFVLDPPVMFLPHSRRVKELDVTLRATQLFGCEGIQTSWKLPAGTTVEGEDLDLEPAHSCPVTLKMQLGELRNECPDVDVFLLEAVNKEWYTHSSVIRQSATRHPRIAPARVWLGIVPPKAHVNHLLELTNDTYQRINWRGTVWRWHHENKPSFWCSDLKPCKKCHERVCTCTLLRPSKGTLEDKERVGLVYNVFAPETDGCVATLLQVRRTSGDTAPAKSGAGGDARASLVFYRVLAPELVLRVLPCHGNKVYGECLGCSLDQSAGSGLIGTAVLRPSSTLTVDRCSCYRLRFTNITPLLTTVTWDLPMEQGDVIQVTFIPNSFDIGSYAEVETSVVIKAKKVCKRQLFVFKARVEKAHKPLYLLIEVEVAGLEVTFEMPLGGDVSTDSTLTFRNTQKGIPLISVPKPRSLTNEEIFAEEDIKRSVQQENICHCRYKMMYVPPVKRPKPPPTEDDPPSIDFVLEPPSLTRVCPCDVCSKPVIPENEEKYSIQFKRVPLNTVRSRTVILRNDSVLTAKWDTAVRNWPRVRSKVFTTADPWAVDVKDPGIAIEVTPSCGLLMPRARLEIKVSVYADCWGFYKDQILIKIEKLDPVILEVWVEVFGSPLYLVMKTPDKYSDDIPTLWVSESNPNRVVRLKNNSRAELIIYNYILRENERSQDILPFRLYLRFYDTLPPTCRCVDAEDFSYQEEEIHEESSITSVSVAMATGIELFIGADYGRQKDMDFEVKQNEITIAPLTFCNIEISLSSPAHGELAANAVLLVRTIPTKPSGSSWIRPEPEPQLVRLRQTQREGTLLVSDCKVVVKCCALDLPCEDIMRIRKYIQVQNVGNGHLYLRTATKDPWSIVRDAVHGDACGTGCVCGRREYERSDNVELHLHPRSSQNVCVEVSLKTKEHWPNSELLESCGTPIYPETKKTVTSLLFYDNDNVLSTVYLVLRIEYPILKLNPTSIDFGFVTDGDTRKTYFTVGHTSRTASLCLTVEWHGVNDFKIWPNNLELQPWSSGKVYIQYTSRWRGGVAEGFVRVMHGNKDGVGAWCRADLPVSAAPSRDHKCHSSIHDFTDDVYLLPPGVHLM